MPALLLSLVVVVVESKITRAKQFPHAVTSKAYTWKSPRGTSIIAITFKDRESREDAGCSRTTHRKSKGIAIGDIGLSSYTGAYRTQYPCVQGKQ